MNLNGKLEIQLRMNIEMKNIQIWNSKQIKSNFCTKFIYKMLLDNPQVLFDEPHNETESQTQLKAKKMTSRNVQKWEQW